MGVRAKFYVESKTENSNGMEPGGGFVVVMRPVMGDKSKENQEFYKWTPGGELKLATINHSAAAQLEVGKRYYLDLTPADQ